MTVTTTLGEKLAGLVASRFEALHGRQPDGLFAAPGRINLIGEHSDHDDGPCLPFALVPDDRRGAVRTAVHAAFAERGWPAPGLFEAVPSAGAHRVELDLEEVR